MKLRVAVALLLMVVTVAACGRSQPETPGPSGSPTSDDAAARARADSIAAANAAREAAEREQRAQLARAQEILTSPVYFGYDSETLDAETEERLRLKASILRANPTMELRIEGHADERGSTEYNLALGQRRAESVRTFLTGYGIAPNRVNTISYGKERPAVAGSNESAWARNRRAEFAVTGGSISAIPPEIR